MFNSFRILILGLITFSASIIVAVILNLYLVPSALERKPQSAPEYQESIWSIESLNNRIQHESCDCNFIDFPRSYFETETTQSCRAERTTLEPLFNQLPPDYTKSREQGAFPKVCLTFIMKRFGPQNQRSSMFASCSSSSLRVSKRAFKPCITEKYVNVTFNTFSDIATCMGINPKYLIPKIANESGFHVNAFGMGFDTGIGQLTGPAIKHVNRYFKTYHTHVMNSNRESCKRLQPLLSNQVPVPHDTRSRCALMRPPQNPALNMFYLAIKFQIDYLTLNKMFDRMQINRLLRQAGLSNVSEEKIKIMLLNLAYNAGAQGAINHFREYILYRIQLKAKGFRGLSATDLDISGQNLKPTTKQHPLTFSQYLIRYQRVGTKGYLSRLKNQADELDRAFYPGACTFENYLQVSSGG